MTTETYNGYANYQTWCVALWLDNEPYTNEYLFEIANDPARSNLEKIDALEELVTGAYYEHYSEHLNGTMFADLMTHALGAVDWREIIESHREG